jgi:hypothetical protein
MIRVGRKPTAEIYPLGWIFFDSRCSGDFKSCLMDIWRLSPKFGWLA